YRRRGAHSTFAIPACGGPRGSKGGRPPLLQICVRGSKGVAPLAPNRLLDVSEDRGVLIEAINRLAVVRGEVTLSSGRTADYYIDLRRITLDGAAAPVVGRVMRDLVADWEFDAVGGLTLGADPVATAMLHSAAAEGDRLDAFVVRKAEKAHGL